MNDRQDVADPALLRRFVPLDSLSEDSLARLAAEMRAERLSAGTTLYGPETEPRAYFLLLEGEVAITDPEGGTETVGAGTGPARFPLGQARARRCRAVARSDVRCLVVDHATLDAFVTWEQSASHATSALRVGEARDADDWLADDWMARMLQSQVFHHVPPVNLQAMFMRMEPRPVQAGEVVVRQGEPGEYYYVIKRGRFAVWRCSESTGSTVRLAELGSGDGFGEEALLAEGTRNATVTAESDGTLMRLSKRDFDELLKAPVVRRVDYAEAQALVEQGAKWLDVRLESEHEQHGLPGALNVPLYLLRVKGRRLPRRHAYIAYCDTGNRSSVAAFLLNELGYDVRVLAGGTRAIAAPGER